MPTRKRRILMCNEASYLLTGYGTYGKEVISRLVDCGKFEVAEFATYGKVGDSRDKHVRWRYYPNSVDKKDDRWAHYDSIPQHQFGSWRFDRVLLDFKPDIVFDIRDYYMMGYQAGSPYRKFFHWAIMPTVDSAPQKEEWVAGFLTADAVFTYSDWGGKVVREQSQNRINYQGTASPGVDLELFKPVEDKKRHRTDMAFEEDAYIIGTVMRNQRRKLYPDLFQAFRTFLDNAPKELADKTYLYVHTSYPDLGWDIPSLLKEFSLGSKVLFTYICQYTNSPFCSFFQGAKTYSPYSNSSTGTLPNAGIGLTQEQMVQIFNLFDVYVQYSICEGFGMPQAEAAACGVPVMAVDYSAMADVVRQTGGIPLKVERMFRELESNAYRALPDNDYAAKAFEKFLSLNDGIKKKKGMQARKAAEKYFNWDNTAKVWENYFEHVPLTGLQGKWDTPPDLHMPPSVKKEGLNNKEFLDWIYKEVTNEPEKLNSLHALNILRDLNWGFSATGGEMVPFNQDIAFETYFNYARNKFVCEQARAGLLDMEYPDFISYADHKEEMGKRFIRMSG